MTCIQSLDDDDGPYGLNPNPVRPSPGRGLGHDLPESVRRVRNRHRPKRPRGSRPAPRTEQRAPPCEACGAERVFPAKHKPGALSDRWCRKCVKSGSAAARRDGLPPREYLESLVLMPDLSGETAFAGLMRLVDLGVFRIDDEGRVWREMAIRGSFLIPCEPRRAEVRHDTGYAHIQLQFKRRRYCGSVARVIATVKAGDRSLRNPAPGTSEVT